MALSEIYIQQITGGSWVSHLEVGGMIAKRRTVSAASFGGAIAGMIEAYVEIAPAEAVQAADFGAVRVALDALLPLPTEDDGPEPRQLPQAKLRASLPPLRDARGA